MYNNETNYEKAIADIRKMPCYDSGNHTVYLRIASNEEADQLVADLRIRWNCKKGETGSLRLDKDTIYKGVGFYSQKAEGVPVTADDPSINFHYLNNQIDWINATTYEDHMGVNISIPRNGDTHGQKYYTAQEIMDILEKEMVV